MKFSEKPEMLAREILCQCTYEIQMDKLVVYIYTHESSSPDLQYTVAEVYHNRRNFFPDLTRNRRLTMITITVNLRFGLNDFRFYPLILTLARSLF
jgi:hypothetical protein